MTSSSSSSAGEREVEGYALGIDLGTTFTSAAVRRGGRSTIVELGTRSAAAPSVVLLRSDETVLAGEAADRRATTEPNRVAREFKRRLGDPTPLLLGGTPYSADALTGRMLRWVALGGGVAVTMHHLGRRTLDGLDGENNTVCRLPRGIHHHGDLVLLANLQHFFSRDNTLLIVRGLNCQRRQSGWPLSSRR